MQKMVFKNGSELLIHRIFSEVKFIDGVQREFYNIEFNSDKDFNEIKALFSDSSNLSEFDLFLVEEGKDPQYQGTHYGINVLQSITYNLEDETYLVQLTRPSQIEEQLRLQEQAILELSMLLAGGAE